MPTLLGFNSNFDFVINRNTTRRIFNALNFTDDIDFRNKIGRPDRLKRYLKIKFDIFVAPPSTGGAAVCGNEIVCRTITQLLTAMHDYLEAYLLRPIPRP